MQNELNLWDFIPSSEFKVPDTPTNEAARDHSRRFWRWFKQFVKKQPKKDLSNISKKQHFIPGSGEFETIEPDWRQAADALETQLSSWFENSPNENSNLRTLIGPPGSNVSSVLQEVAQRQKFQILSPPPPGTILDDFNSHKSILNMLNKTDDEILVIPQLEGFYLRHEDGLTLIRNMIERLVVSRRVLIGCDSWAWAFLQQAIGIEDQLGQPMTIAPFDDQRLDLWFRLNCDLQEKEFRHSHDDKPVFPAPSQDAGNEAEKSLPETSGLIKSLAARSRGNLGVALALWRSSLRVDPKSDKSASEKQTAGPIIWVESPYELESPKPSAGFNQQHRFMLHTILLHGGLPLPILAALLPSSREEVYRQMSELRLAGMIRRQNDRFSIALTAYPLVRQELVSERFLADVL